jgi:hypothetical protein
MAERHPVNIVLGHQRADSVVECEAECSADSSDGEACAKPVTRRMAQSIVARFCVAVFKFIACTDSG